MTRITLDSVHKEFDDVHAVKGIDLEVRDGELLVLVGPSGCGKSTTLRLVAGLEKPTDGEILFGSEQVTTQAPSTRDVAMVFQNYALYPHMTAERNMSFGARSATDFATSEIDRRVTDAANTLDIEGLLERKPSELSGGEKQRVAIGRALVRDPEVFLLDEPLSNLDAKLRVQMRGELASLHDEIGVTMVYVTHDQTEALTLGDRVAVMNEGSIQQIDAPQRLYDFPANRFVAEFVGSPAMNTVPVTIVEVNGTVYGETENFSIAFPDDTHIATHIGKRLILGVRPEDLTPVADPGDAAFTADPYATEPLGDVQLVRCLAGDHDLIVQAEPHAGLDVNSTVQVDCDTDRLHLFDVESGAAVYHSDPAFDANRSEPPESRVVG